METGLTRRYPMPTPLSAAATLQYRQFINSSTAASPLRDIPEAHDLSVIKNDLENMAADPEIRLQRLKKDLNYLVENVKVYESVDGNHRPTKGGKDINAVMERLRVKQEERHSTDDTDLRYHGRVSKSQYDRQVALETLRRRRRRDEMDEGQENDKQSRLADFWPTKVSSSKRSEKDEPRTEVLPLQDTGRKQESQSALPGNVEKQESDREDVYVKKQKADSVLPTPPARGNESHGKNSHRPQPQAARPQSTHTKRNSPSSSEPDLGFVRVKPKDQVPLATFYAALEPCFRPLTEEDREFLQAKGDDVTPYTIPPLGRHYLDTWAEEDRAAMGITSPPLPQSEEHSGTQGQRYLNPNERLKESHLLEQDLSCGSLTERLISALVLERPINDLEQGPNTNGDNGGSVDTQTDSADELEEEEKEYQDEEEIDPMELCTSPPEDVIVFEDALRRELQYVGLLGDDDEPDWHAREDDDVCAELRRLQRELKAQVETNDFRKKRLLEVVDCQLQYDQYRQVADVLDAQVEQQYAKRYRIQKSKKKKASTSVKSGLSENLLSAMQKRNAWVNGLGKIFADKNVVMPATSIYGDVTNGLSC